jgi:hypothetical protein
MINQKDRFGQLLRQSSNNASEHALHKRAEALPCTVKEVVKKGLSVRVAIEISDIQYPIIEIPIISGEHFRLPIKAGDKGLALPCNYYMGGINGNGGGTASSNLSGNLNDLVFIPVSSLEWRQGDNTKFSLFVKLTNLAHMIEPTRIFTKCATIIRFCMTLRDKINEVIAVVNAHTGSVIMPVIATLDETSDNVAEKHED